MQLRLRVDLCSLDADFCVRIVVDARLGRCVQVDELVRSAVPFFVGMQLRLRVDLCSLDAPRLCSLDAAFVFA